MTASVSYMGKDRSGWLYLQQLAYMSAELASSLHQRSIRSDETLTASVKLTCWGVFNEMTFVLSMSYMFKLTEVRASSMAHMQPAVMPLPQQERPPYDHTSSSTWIPYPVLEETNENHPTCLYNSLCDLSLICYDVTNLLFSKDHKPPRYELEFGVDRLYERLQEWKQRLPGCLDPYEYTCPHVFSLQ
jgi:hypothetical protein